MEIYSDNKYNLAARDTTCHGCNSNNAWTAAPVPLLNQPMHSLNSDLTEHKPNSQLHSTRQHHIGNNSNEQQHFLDYKYAGSTFKEPKLADLRHSQTTPLVSSSGISLPVEGQPQISPSTDLQHRRIDALGQSNENKHLKSQNPLPLPPAFQLQSSVIGSALELNQARASPAFTLPAQWSSLSPPQTPWSTDSTTLYDGCSDSDDSDEISTSHPNEYPVQIEHHNNKFCGYKRQTTRSGEKIKQKMVTTYDPITLEPQTSLQKTKHYQKHLVRICRCGRYQVMDGALQQGRANNCNGYEIHYNQKCRWKAYDDMVTSKRVLIRLCKCYRPPT